MLPLSSAIKIGADEDYELSKATLCNHGYKLYTQIWNDQPPLVTTIIARVVKLAPHSVLAPRLLTVAFSVLLIAATFFLVRDMNGPLAASVTAAMLIGSPGFLELTCSVMQEIPAFAPAVAALCLLQIGPRTNWRITELLAGAVFSFALQMKLIEMAYLPIAALIVFLRSAHQSARAREFLQPKTLMSFVRGSAVFSVSLLITFVALNYLTGNSLILELKLSWAAHFAAAKSFEYGAPEEHGYSWLLLLQNWETTIPAAFGVWFLLRNLKGKRTAIISVAWLTLSLAVFGTHKPWWPYYYVHNAFPLCWCAGVGISTFCGLIYTSWLRRAEAMASMNPRVRVGARPPIFKGNGLLLLRFTTFAAFLLSASVWMTARVWLEELAIRSSPKLYTCLVLNEIERFKPFTKFMFSDEPVYSFHADLPMPPHLAVLSLKRFWTGELTRAGLVEELATLKPGLVLRKRDSQPVPYEDLLNREYKLVYQDGEHLLYAHQSISRKPSF